VLNQPQQPACVPFKLLYRPNGDVCLVTQKRMQSLQCDVNVLPWSFPWFVTSPGVDCWLLPHGGSYCWPSHLPPLFHCYATSSRLGSSAQSSHISYCLYYVWLLIVTLFILGAQRVIGEDPHGSSPISLVVLGPIPGLASASSTNPSCGSSRSLNVHETRAEHL
jgi:hypothetical protein